VKASDKERELRTAPPHTFDLGPGAWATRWEGRPLEPLKVGLRRVSAHDRSAANVQAIARADRAFEKLPHRRGEHDPLWLKTWEIAFVHYLIGYALCHPQDVSKNMWPDQDGDMSLVAREDQDGKPGAIPLVSRRFSDAGIVRCYDELEVLERMSGVQRRSARDGELMRFGAELASGSILAALRETPSEDARAVEAHLRVLLAQAIDLVSAGREAPHPAAV
jgi:hypothetical protein